MAAVLAGKTGDGEGVKLLYHSFSKSGGDKLIWKLDSGRLRILCYHGVCEDYLADQPWMPQSFVTASAFERQLQYLARNAEVLPLPEAVRRLQNGSLPDRCVSLTFDDGYANNYTLAYPLLKKHGMPATIFVSSAYMESGEFFPFLKVKLLQLGRAANLPDYKTAPLNEVEHAVSGYWHQARLQLSDEQRRTLRPLSVEEIRSMDLSLVEFAPHSHTHCILRNETAERRREEIRTSVRKVREWASGPVRLFSYPNGQRGDFDEQDKDVLRAEGIVAAVSGISGANDRHTDMLELRRYPVALFHDDAGFRAEVTGFRSAVLTATRRRAS